MKYLLLIFLILLLPLQTFADLDSIVVTINRTAIFDADVFLIWYRQQVHYANGRDTLIIQANGTTTSIMRSVDGGATWATQASDIAGFGSSPNYGTDHQHGFLLNDTLHKADRAPELDSNTFSRLDANGALTVIATRRVGSGANCNYAQAVLSVVKTGSYIVGGVRGGDCNLRYVVTDDFFATQTDGFIEDYTSILGATNTRGGMRLGHDGQALYTAWLDYASVDSIVLYSYDTLSDVWSKIPGGLGHSKLTRFYTVGLFHDTAYMIAGPDLASQDTLYFAWKGENGSWTKDTVFTKDVTGEMMAHLVYVDSIDVLGLFYVANGNLYFRYWRDNYTWSPEYTLIGDDTTLTTISSMASSFTTPPQHGPVTGIMVKTTSGEAYYVHVKLWDDGGVVDPDPPDGITDLYIKMGNIIEGKL